MGPEDVILAPLRLVKAVTRAAEDLNAIAERARREPDPVEEVRALLDDVINNLRGLNLHAAQLDQTAGRIVTGGDDLRQTGEKLDGHMITLIDGGEDLRQTAEKLDGHAAELIDGGADLTDTAKELAAHLAVFRAALPRLMQALGTVEELETAVETVADTVEPLQGIANGVGRVRRRLSSSTD